MDNVSEAITKVLTLPAQIELSKANTTAQAANAQTMYGAIGEMLSGMMEDSNTLGNSTDTPLTVRSRALEQYNAELQNNNIAVEAGFNQDMAIDIRAIMLRDIRNSIDSREAASKKLAEDKAVSLFDDPLLAVMNAFTIPWTEQEVEGWNKKIVDKKHDLETINSGVTASAQAQNAIKKTLTLDAINDQTKALEGMVANQKRKLSVDLLNSNLAGIKFAMDADHKQLTMAAELNKYLNDERNYSLHLKSVNAQMEQRDWALEERMNEKKAFTDRLAFVNLALTRSGVPTISTIYDLKSKMQTTEGKKLIDDLTDKGRVLADPRYAATYTHGDPGNVASYVKFWRDTGTVVSDADKPLSNLMLESYQKAQSKEAKVKGVEATAEQYLNHEFNARFEVVKKDDGVNPNRAQTFTTMADRAARTRDPAFRKVFDAAIAPNISDSNKAVSAHPELVGPMVASAVEKGLVSPNDGAMFLADFYKASTQLATENSKVRELTGKAFTRFAAEVDTGIPIGKALAGTGALMGGTVGVAMGHPIIGGAAVVGGAAYAFAATRSTKQTVEWTDPVQTQAYLVRKIISASAGEKITAKPTGAPL